MSAQSSASKRSAWREVLSKQQPTTAPAPAFGPGDQVRVWCRILERDRVRQVPFEGTVVRRRGAGFGETFTVRRVTHGEGVERVFPVLAPVLERIEVLRRSKVHRERLYFLRTKVGKTRFAEADAGGPAKSSGASDRTSSQPSSADPVTEPLQQPAA